MRIAQSQRAYRSNSDEGSCSHMQTVKVVSPVVGASSFNCPYCNALAHQAWFNVTAVSATNFLRLIQPDMIEEAKGISDSEARERFELEIGTALMGGPYLSAETNHQSSPYLGNIFVSRCFSCTRLALWLRDKIIYPYVSASEPPHPDLPDEVRNDYEEARAILDRSPRGSAALLRLCVQKICRYGGQKGENINEDIKGLVQAGLPAQVQQALDVVRVVGNNAVHPGSIHVADDRSTASSLFSLINIICEEIVGKPKRLAEMYGKLPETAQAAIAKRDGKN